MLGHLIITRFTLMKAAESGFSGRVKPTASFLEGKVIIFKSVLSYFRNFSVVSYLSAPRAHTSEENRKKNTQTRTEAFSFHQGAGARDTVKNSVCRVRREQTEMLDIPAVLGPATVSIWLPSSL